MVAILDLAMTSILQQMESLDPWIIIGQAVNEKMTFEIHIKRTIFWWPDNLGNF